MQSSRPRPWLPLALIVLAGALVYSNSLAGPFIVDDQSRSPAHHLVAVQLIAAGQLEEAIRHLREAVRDDPRAHYTLGLGLSVLPGTVGWSD